VIGSQTLVDPSAISNIPLDTWKDITAVAVVNTGDAAVGQDLTIRLSAFKGMVELRSQGQFDNVRLDYNTAVPVELSGFTVE